MQAFRSKERQRELKERLSRLERERDVRRLEMDRQEQAIQGISELYELSKRFLGTLDVDQVLQMTDEAFIRWLPHVKASEREIYLKTVRSLMDQGEVSVEALASRLPLASTDIGSRERWGIVGGQLALGLRRVSLYHQVQEMAIQDGLTGLFVRRYFLERLEEEVARAHRRQTSLAFLMVDLDHFKRINDTYGHLVGDRVLREVSHLIRRSVREMDLVGRYGGEEFGVALPEADRALGIQIADRIREAVQAAPIAAYDEKMRLTVSIGVALCPKDAKTAEELIESSDRAMYEAKGMGRNRTVAVSP